MESGPFQVFDAPNGNKVEITFFDGVTVSIKGDIEATYTVSFIDSESNLTVYQNDIPIGHWTGSSCSIPRLIFRKSSSQ